MKRVYHIVSQETPLFFTCPLTLVSVQTSVHLTHHLSFFFSLSAEQSGQSDNSNQQGDTDVKPPPNGKFTSARSINLTLHVQLLKNIPVPARSLTYTVMHAHVCALALHAGLCACASVSQQSWI